LVNSIFKTWCQVCKAEVKVKAEKYYNKALDARYKRADEVDLYVKKADARGIINVIITYMVIYNQVSPKC